MRSQDLTVKSAGETLPSKWTDTTRYTEFLRDIYVWLRTTSNAVANHHAAWKKDREYVDLYNKMDRLTNRQLAMLGFDRTSLPDELADIQDRFYEPGAPKQLAG